MMNEKNMPCAYWGEGDVCLKNTEPGYTDFCVLGPCSQMKPSNADKIRQMSDEELAERLSKQNFWNCPPHDGPCPGEPGCRVCWLDWLKQEVRDED